MRTKYISVWWFEQSLRKELGEEEKKLSWLLKSHKKKKSVQTINKEYKKKEVYN